MAILLSASTLGSLDLFKLRNQTTAYWARYIVRLVGIRLGRAFSLYILSRCPAPFEFARGWNYYVRGESKVMATRSGRAAIQSI
jgi:hypothetical protein